MIEKNNSINTFTINYNKEEECNLYSLQDKLKNLSDLTINVKNKNEIKTIVEIKENINFKINKFSLLCGGNKILKFYIQSFENLKEIDIKTINGISSISLPLFTPKCKVMFSSLVKFHYKNSNGSISGLTLNNFIDNILCMPNLKDFSFEIKNHFENLNFYHSFFVNISMLKVLNSVNIKIFDIFNERRIFKSNEDLKELFSDINLKHIAKINIEIFIK